MMTEASPEIASEIPANRPNSSDLSANLAWKLKWFSIVGGVLYAGYQITNRWHWRPPVVLPQTWLDRNLPLLEWTIWPYFALVGCVFLPLGLKDRRLFRRYLVALACGYPLNLLTFALWPTMLPREGLPEGVRRAAFAWLYQVDTPANCFPSGHITAPFIAFYFLASQHRKWRIPLWIGFALLCPSILTTKQHYVADLFGGLATGALGVWLSSRWLRAARPSGNRESQIANRKVHTP